MKNLLRKATISAAAMALSAGFAMPMARPQQTANPEDLAAIHKVIDGFLAAFNRHDAHAVASWFSEDGELMNAQQSVTHSRKEIEEHLVPVFASRLKNAHRTCGAPTIRMISPDAAFVSMDYELSGTMGPGDIELPVRKGIYHWILTWHTGKWTIDVMDEFEALKSPAPKA